MHAKGSRLGPTNAMEEKRKPTNELGCRAQAGAASSLVGAAPTKRAGDGAHARASATPPGPSLAQWPVRRASNTVTRVRSGRPLICRVGYADEHATSATVRVIVSVRSHSPPAPYRARRRAAEFYQVLKGNSLSSCELFSTGKGSWTVLRIKTPHGAGKGSWTVLRIKTPHGARCMSG